MMELGHASADMVTEQIKGCCKANITLASVYNILTQLADLGIYDHRLSANNKMYFDVNTFRHIHIYDEENHAYKDVIDDKLIEIIDEHLKNKRFRGYSVQGVDVQILAKPTKAKKCCKKKN